MKIKSLAVLGVILCNFLFSHSLFAQDIGGSLKLGIDLEGEIEFSEDYTSENREKKEDVENGFSVAGEFFAKISDNIELGAGIIYQFPRSGEDSEDVEFNFVPIYGTLRMRSSNKNMAPYLIGQMGYNFFYGDSLSANGLTFDFDYKGGLYWGIGGGFLIKKKFLVELLYSVNNGTIELFGYEFDTKYSKVSISLGYNF